MASALTILHRDAHVVAVAKPAGLLVHRTALDRGAREFAVQTLRRQLGCPVYPAHRLDRGTSGVLLFALTPDAHRALNDAFEARAVHKRYLAVVRGWPPDAGTIDHALERIVDPLDADPAAAGDAAQDAVTAWCTLARAELPIRADRYPTSRYALLELEPLTGRRHQLRRHLKHANHPIVGDTTYGKGTHNRLFRERYGCARMLLHAVELRLVHPVTRTPVEVVAPLDGEFRSVVEALGWASALPGAWLPAATAA